MSHVMPISVQSHWRRAEYEANGYEEVRRGMRPYLYTFNETIVSMTLFYSISEVVVVFLNSLLEKVRLPTTVVPSHRGL